MNHGHILRIHPRAKDISATYSGCQVTFASVEDKWVPYLLLEVVEGDPVRFWGEGSSDFPELACRYKKGKAVAGDPKVCDSIRLFKSMAPGCIKAIGDWLAKEPLDASNKPAGCSWE